MNYYIYLTTNLINGKKYIGQHYGQLNDDYLGSGTLILKAIQKYGKENFSKEILEICKSREEADEKEAFYITKFNAIEDENYYNLREGGLGGDGWRSCYKWLKQHPEEAQKIYAKNTERLREWEKSHPEEYKQNIQKMLEGSKQYWEGHPQQRQELMIKINLAKEKWQQEHPEEHRKQVEEWRQKGTETNSKAVMCVTTQEVFPSISEAGRFYKVPQANISACLQGKRKSAGKHPETGEKLFWKFIEK